MISFACKEIDFKELIKCSFDLKKTDYTVFDFLMKHTDYFTIDKLSKELKLERSGVQKSIRNLVARDLVVRKQQNLDTGGYKFHYYIKDKEVLKSRVESIIDGWHAKVKDEIKKWV